MNVLVINAGSSSLKYQLLNSVSGALLAKGHCERIGIDGKFTYYPKLPGKQAVEDVPFNMPTHSEAIQAVLKALVDPDNGILSSLKEIEAVGHRIVHGGRNFTTSVLVDEDVIKEITRCIPLAPLHNPAHLKGIEACRKALGPDVPQAVVFDTAFHHTMPPKAYIYPIPYEYYEKNKIRRYGFHGTSHRYVSGRAAKLLGKNVKDLNLITCHLGNGASLAAVKGGKSIDTSMGLTPLAGLPMGTRCGDLDPTILSHIMNQYHLDINQVMTILNKKSGMLGISGVSPDFRDLIAAIKKGNARAQLAIDIFIYDVKKDIGAYAAAMGGVDAIVFTAGVGEHSYKMREAMVGGLEFMGVKLDSEKNASCYNEEAIISADDSPVKVLVVPTNEELMIAIDTDHLASGREAKTHY